MTKLEKILTFLENAKSIVKHDQDHYTVDGKKLRFIRGEGYLGCKVEGFGLAFLDAELIEMALSAY